MCVNKDWDRGNLKIIMINREFQVFAWILQQLKTVYCLIHRERDKERATETKRNIDREEERKRGRERGKIYDKICKG